MARFTKESKDELLEKVYGKSAPNRKLSEQDLQILRNNPFTGEELSDEWKSLKENSEKLRQQTQQLLDSYTDKDLDNLRSELQRDFGKDFPIEKQESMTIVYNQLELSEKFEAVEIRLNEKVLCQKDYNHELITAFRRPMVMGRQTSNLNNAILVSGQKATGRHSSLDELSKLLVEYDILPKADYSTIDLTRYSTKENENTFVQDLYAAINNSQIIIFDNLENIAPAFLPFVEEIVTTGKLTLNKRYTANNSSLVETSNALVKNSFHTLNFEGKYLVFLTTLSVKKLLNVVGARFINTMADIVVTKDIIKSDIAEIYNAKTNEFIRKCQDKLNINVKLDESVVNYVEDNFLDSDNCQFVISLLNHFYDALAQFKLQNLGNDSIEVTLTNKDNTIVLLNNTASKPLDEYLPKVMSSAVDEVKKELDDIVGLTAVKKYILSLEGFYAAQKLREKQGFKTTEVSKHMIFTGNPGTGKTTIARLLAKYLKAIGVLSNGQLIEVSRNDLVGRYLGHTAPQTMQVVKSALGGVLFIDEAYSLYRGQNDSFGLEAIDTLVKAMEDNRDDLIVILAGYTREMEEFLTSNSGLKSRFPNIIEFPDYTGEELYKIMLINAKSKGYRVDPEAEAALIAYFDTVQKFNATRSGNGRLARNVIEEAIINQSTRIIADMSQPLDLIKLEDFNLDEEKN